jgi:hypothetical protein
MLQGILASRYLRVPARAAFLQRLARLPRLPRVPRWRATVALLAAALGAACGVDKTTLLFEGGALDASSIDATDDSLSGDDGSACRPGDVQTYVPGPYHPATAAWRGLCTTDQMQAFYTACLDPAASTASCRAFSQVSSSNATCASCILTPEQASAYGPLVDHGSFITENVGGCIELAEPSGLPCAKAQQALVGCQIAACEANCPVHDTVTRAAYDHCTSEAARAGCQAYASQAACSLGTPEGGASATCSGQTFEGFYVAVVPFFCGPPPPPSDAGLPPHDASADATPADAPSTDGASSDARYGDASVTDAPPSDARADGDAASD